MFDFIIYQGNANQNHTEITSSQLEWLLSKQNKMLVRIWRKESLHTVGRNVQYSYYENSMEVPQETK
jgi:hypothetical protein